MEIKPGDIVFNADASGEVVAYQIETITTTETVDGTHVVYQANARGNSKQLRADETFAGENEARAFLMSEATSDYDTKSKQIAETPVKYAFVDTTKLPIIHP